MSNRLMQKLTKAMDKAGKQTSKAIVKGKIMAIQKIAHAEATPEIAEIVGALERLKATKNEVESLADVARYLYDARINQANYQVDLSHQLRDARTAEEDGWSKLAVTMGNALSRLESIHSEHCEKMKEEFVAPLEKFRDVDVAEVQKLKLRYKEVKSAYDVACAKEQSARDGGQSQKMQAAFAKKQESEGELKRMRDEFLKSVESLERQKNTELLGLVLDYWSKYVQFGKAQHNALQASVIPDEIDPSSYVGGRFQTTTPGGDEFGGPEFQTNFDEQADELKDNNNVSNVNNEVGGGYGDTGEQNGDYNENYDNNGNGGNEQDYNEQNDATNPFNDEYDDGTGQQQQQQGGGYDDGTGDVGQNDQNYDDGNDANNNYDENDNTNYQDQDQDKDNTNFDNDGNDDYTNNNNTAETTNPFDNGGNNEYYDDGTNNQNGGGGGGDPLDFDPYAGNQQGGGQTQPIGQQNY